MPRKTYQKLTVQEKSVIHYLLDSAQRAEFTPFVANEEKDTPDKGYHVKINCVLFGHELEHIANILEKLPKLQNDYDS